MHARIGSLAFAMLLAAQIASADGVFIPPEETYGRLYGDLGATSTEQKGIIIQPAEGREVLLLQTTYHGPASGFAWVVPVPGEPLENDVFIASADFIAHVLNVTEPIVETHIDIPRPRSATDDVDLIAPPSPPSEEAAAEESVTLHRRMAVGDYDVSILSATGPNVLIGWLNDNGYATPEEHASIFDQYVGKGWFFVALRVLPEVVEEKPVLHDVKPVGISFWCDEVVYPLHISRASSREKTALTLVSLTREPVECEQLARSRLPLGNHGMGTSYARIRRETIEARREPSAIIEYAGYHGVTEPHLSWRDGIEENLSSADLRELWATRLWTILDRDEMEDLTLATAEVRGERVAINRRGALPGPPLWERVNVPPWLTGGVLFLLLGLLRVGARRIPLPLLYAALTVGALAVLLPGLPRWLQPWVIVMSLLTAFITVPIVIGSERRGQEDDGLRTGAELARWSLLAIGWIAAAGGIRPAYSLSPLDGTGFPLLLVLAGFMMGAMGGASAIADRSSAWRAVAAAIAAGGLLVYQTAFGRPHLPMWLRDTGTDAMWVGGLTVALLLLAAYGAIALMRRGGAITRREHLAILLTALVAGGILAWASGGYLLDLTWLGSSSRGAFDSLPLILLLALIFGLAWAALPRQNCLGDVARAFALTLLLLGAGMAFGRISVLTPAHAGEVSIRHTGLAELDRALTQLDEALLAFLEDTGSYPARLEDLTGANPPQTGLDSSGNPVPVPQGWPGPYLKQLPEDPLTASRETWVYEVTGSPMIDSGGLSIEVSMRETWGLR